MIPFRTNPYLKSLLALFLLGVLIAGCKKDDDEDEASYDTTTSKDNSVADKLMSDVFGQMDAAARQEDSVKAANNALPDCATLTVQASSNPTPSNPNELWIDYGNGCTDSSGVTRSGKIYAKFTGRYRDSLTEIVVRPQNYTVNDHQVEGVKRITNKGHNSNGNLWYTVEVDSVKVTGPKGNWSSTWESSRTREWIEGEPTKWWPWDDVYLIEGSASGTNRNGRDYQVDITDPLRVEIGCPWIVQGELEVDPDGLQKRYVDYGDGSCDSKLVVTIDGKEYKVYAN